jgi:hypothetical protein
MLGVSVSILYYVSIDVGFMFLVWFMFLLVRVHVSVSIDAGFMFL